MTRRIISSFIFLLVLTGIGLAQQDSTYAVKLTWDANSEPDLAGYKIYFGNGSRSYHTVVDVGNVVLWQIDGLAGRRKWFFAATAYDTARNESGYSNEVWIFLGDSTAVDIIPPAPPENVKAEEKEIK